MSDLIKIQKVMGNEDSLRDLEEEGQETYEDAFLRLYGDGDAGIETDSYIWNHALKERIK